MSDHYIDYWGPGRIENALSDLSTDSERSGEIVSDPVMTTKIMEDYWGSPRRAPLAIEPMPDIVPWTIATAEETAEGAPDGVDVTQAIPYPVPDTTGLPDPGHSDLEGRDEIGYGRYGADAPFIASAQQLLEQRIIVAVAEKIVAEQRPLLTQQKVAEHAHFESWPFANGQIVSPTTRVGTRHPNGIGYLIIASGVGLYVGENQSVGAGNLGIPVPIGTIFLSLPVNTDLWVSSAGVALAQATSLYIIQLYMGATTL